MYKKIFITILFTILYLSTFCQVDYPQNYFRSPFDIKLYMSGSFGELRSNHFHSGIDIRTQGVEGKKLFAIADGYISRINISAWGYGYALYITHSNGYISVYGHMQKYNDAIEKYVKEKQYERQEFAMNLYPNPDEFPLNKGDFIGLSGNSGYSFGPHLHFEIRNKDDEPIDPLLFGFSILDNVKPKFKKLAIYPANDSCYVNKQNKKKIIDVSGSNGKYRISQIIKVQGSIYFGIEAYDYLNFVGSQNAVNEVQLFVDDVLYYHHKLESFSFYNSRAINSLVDYKERITSSSRIQRAYIEPNNKLSIYKHSKNNGVVIFNDNNTHDVKYVIKDSHGNKSVLEFTVKSVLKEKNKEKIPLDYQMLMSYKNENIFMKDEIRIMIHKHCLFDNLYFTLDSKPIVRGIYSDIYIVHNEFTPLNRKITISIDGKKVPDSLKQKAIIMRKDFKGKRYSEGGRWLNGFLTIKSKYFGKFYITTDETSPVIKAINIHKNARMGNLKTIEFKVIDNLSGIKEYNGFVDGEWILFKYEGKNNRIYYDFDDRIGKGKHKLLFQVTDAVGNMAEFETDFYY